MSGGGGVFYKKKVSIFLRKVKGSGDKFHKLMR
jgi:hypothetical protein